MRPVSNRELLEWLAGWRLTWATIGRAELAIRVMRRPGSWLLSFSERVETSRRVWAIISRAELARRSAEHTGFRAGCRTWPSTYADGVQAGVNSASQQMLDGLRQLYGESLASHRSHERGDWQPLGTQQVTCRQCSALFPVDTETLRPYLGMAVDKAHLQEQYRAVEAALCPTGHAHDFGGHATRAHL